MQAQERALEKAESDVTVLTAERAHLARPARLEPLARLLASPPSPAANTCASTPTSVRQTLNPPMPAANNK